MKTAYDIGRILIAIEDYRRLTGVVCFEVEKTEDKEPRYAVKRDSPQAGAWATFATEDEAQVECDKMNLRYMALQKAAQDFVESEIRAAIVT
jgi:hypothetical protein